MAAASAVITVMERATASSRVSVFAVIPSTQLTRSVRQARSSQVTDWNSECAMIGSKALSWSCPASTAMETVTSAPAFE